jgi:hypothetical protein
VGSCGPSCACGWLIGGGGVGLGMFALAGGEVDLAGGADQLPDGEGQREQDDGPDGDEDGGGPLGGEVRPEMKELVAVADADPDGDAVADQPADGEGPHEFLARHVHRSGGQDEGRERHRGWEQRGQRDGEDGVLFHPGGHAAEDAFGDVLFEEGHASGLTGGVGEEASDGGADGGDGDEQDGVGVAGGVEDQHDVGYAGDGERDEGAVDDGDEEEADQAEVEEEMDEAVMDGVGRHLRWLGERGWQGDEERGKDRRAGRGSGRRAGWEGQTHAVDMTLAGYAVFRENFLSCGPARTAGGPARTAGGPARTARVLVVDGKRIGRQQRR